MMNKTNNMALLIIKTILCVVIGAGLNLVVHELSHLATLLICGGTVGEMSLGQLSFISGYIEPQHIAIVALSSILIPMCTSVIIMLIPNYYTSSFAAGFTMPTIINGVLGVIAVLFIHDPTRSTYDVALAFDNTNAKILVVASAIICIILCCICMVLCLKRMSRSLDT